MNGSQNPSGKEPTNMIVFMLGAIAESKYQILTQNQQVNCGDTYA